MPTEEERRRKIIIDSEVIIAANRGILAASRDKLDSRQLDALVECDRRYLRAVRDIDSSLLTAEGQKLADEGGT